MGCIITVKFFFLPDEDIMYHQCGIYPYILCVFSLFENSREVKMHHYFSLI